MVKIDSKNILQILGQIFVGVSIVILLTLVADAWTPPSLAPPNLNVSQPLNVSATTQTKTGRLTFPYWYDQDNPGYDVDPGGNSWLYRLYSYDVRSDIFYDRNNTNYYVDPNSTSVLNTISLGGVARSSWPTSVAEADTLQSVTDRGRSTTQNLQSPRFEDRDSSSYYLDPASSSRVNEVQADRVYGFNDIRSPIFYDYNNTGYYADPASNSWLYRLYSYDIRSSIFYDLDNTGYYTDPASTSRLNAVNADSIVDNSGIRVYLCPAEGIAECGNRHSTCNGQLTTNSTCNYTTGSDCSDYNTEPCSYVGKLVQ